MIFLDYFSPSHDSERLLFSGIIEDLGTVDALQKSAQGAVLTVSTALPISRIKLGDSIAVNGACLTVIARSPSGSGKNGIRNSAKNSVKRVGTISMDVSIESLRRTTLGDLRTGDRVNLERSLTLGSLLNGHLVAAHVDGVGKIISIKPEGDSQLFTIEAPASEVRYLVEKGSAAIDGISLTVFAIEGRRFRCAIIPHTSKVTTLGFKRPGSRVNFESDMLGKYVEKFVTMRSHSASAGVR
jgi:riboflavin synthase